MHVLGAAHGVRQHDFPAYLPALLNSHLTDLSVEHALRWHSMVGMFWPFVPSAFRDGLPASASAPSVAWRHPAQYVRRIMICHSRTLPWTSVLRYCSACVDADLISCGRAYWHVAHQWPVSRHCIQHRMQLLPEMASRKTWQLPPIGSTAQPLAEEDEHYKVSAVVQHLASTICQFETVDLKLLRKATLRRLLTLGIIHSTYSVRHDRLDEWYRSQPVSRWCSFAGGGMDQFAASDWLPRLLWRHKQDHPIRWIIAWASLEWQSPAAASQALVDSQRAEPVEDDGQLPLFVTSTSDAISGRRYPSPTAFEQALETETSYAGLMARLGVTRGDVVRWLEAFPEARATWRRRRLAMAIDDAELKVRRHLEQRRGMSRQELNEVAISSLRLMRQHAPERLEQILAGLPSRLDVQRSLFAKR
jgi:hypothetical protein